CRSTEAGCTTSGARRNAQLRRENTAGKPEERGPRGSGRADDLRRESQARRAAEGRYRGPGGHDERGSEGRFGNNPEGTGTGKKREKAAKRVARRLSTSLHRDAPPECYMCD